MQLGGMIFWLHMHINGPFLTCSATCLDCLFSPRIFQWINDTTYQPINTRCTGLKNLTWLGNVVHPFVLLFFMVSVTRCWNKNLPIFSKVVPKSSHSSKINIFKIPQKLTNAWATVIRKAFKNRPIRSHWSRRNKL